MRPGIRRRLLLLVLAAVAAGLAVMLVSFNLLLTHNLTRNADDVLRARAAAELGIVRTEAEMQTALIQTLPIARWSAVRVLRMRLDICNAPAASAVRPARPWIGSSHLTGAICFQCGLAGSIQKRSSVHATSRTARPMIAKNDHLIRSAPVAGARMLVAKVCPPLERRTGTHPSMAGVAPGGEAVTGLNPARSLSDLAA